MVSVGSWLSLRKRFRDLALVMVAVVLAASAVLGTTIARPVVVAGSSRRLVLVAWLARGLRLTSARRAGMICSDEEHGRKTVHYLRASKEELYIWP
jgi:hypothetical protein